MYRLQEFNLFTEMREGGGGVELHRPPGKVLVWAIAPPSSVHLYKNTVPTS